MGTEIERKFLVKSNDYRKLAKPVKIQQGYLCTDPEKTVRVRVYGKKAFLTIKGKVVNLSRPEFEYKIPVDDALSILKLCKNTIWKKRYKINYGDHLWEVDEFLRENKGLILAEIELSSADESFIKPSWIGEEVSQDYRYFNSYLATHPFTTW
ncbi:MAG: CYTH domain-containing protein [Fidelibacterota bacterium]